MITREEVLAVERVIRPHIRRTPVIDVAGSDFGVCDGSLSLKLELLQHTGSFKARGAFTNLLTREVPAAGVVAASGGNHGVAVAYAAMKLGKPATIFVPSVSSAAKIARIRATGAHLEIGGDRYADALAASIAWQAEHGGMSVHAFEQRETLLGQATVALELSEQSPDLDTLLVAVGGGGLIGGIAAYYAGRVKIIAVEPEGAPTLHDALKAGHPVDSATGSIAADSLAPKQVGSMMFPIAQAFVDRVVLVSDDAIRRAQHALWDELRLGVEPGGAAAFAALLSHRYIPEVGENVGVLICGGNGKNLYE